MRVASYRYLVLLLASTMLGLLLLVFFGRDTEAQAAPQVDVLQVCQDSGSEIAAEDLPGVVKPGVCDLRDAIITDNGIGVQVPKRGEGVNAEMLTTTGVQEIEVRHFEDGRVEMEHVGDESKAGAATARLRTRATAWKADFDTTSTLGPRLWS